MGNIFQEPETKPRLTRAENPETPEELAGLGVCSGLGAPENEPYNSQMKNGFRKMIPESRRVSELQQGSPVTFQ